LHFLTFVLSWASIVHNNKAMWLAMWTENVNSATKYVWLSANSSLKGINDMKKYDKARELKVLQRQQRQQSDLNEYFDPRNTLARSERSTPKS